MIKRFYRVKANIMKADYWNTMKRTIDVYKVNDHLKFLLHSLL